MLHSNDARIRELLLQGNVGLEKESLRVLEDGHFSHTPHPFPAGDSNIVRDFSENQTEINTGIHPDAEGAVAELAEHTARIQEVLKNLPEREYLWPFSNPPYIRNEEDIPIAQFDGDQHAKTLYREYLSDTYGRYVMTLSGIHFNFSFGDELLQEDFKLSGYTSFREYKDQLYLELAKKAAQYGWVVTALTAASPILDGSFVEKSACGTSVFTGKASIRCSESGYWNAFTPVFNYDSVGEYADSIQKYVDAHLLAAPSELYYPIRLKPRGVNNLDSLRENGVNHIELRMIDLNPLCPEGLDVRDVKFIRYFLVWLASLPKKPFTDREQIVAVQNFKKAAGYDLKTVRIATSAGAIHSMAYAGEGLLTEMQEFYKDFPQDVQDVLAFEKQKFIDPETRYAWILRKEYAEDYVKKGLDLAKSRQEKNRV